MKKFFYRVEKNDTLSVISARFSVPPSAIIKSNLLLREVEEGDLLCIEKDETKKLYKVGVRDTALSLGERFSVSPEKILSDNGTPYLYFGQIIYL